MDITLDLLSILVYLQVQNSALSIFAGIGNAEERKVLTELNRELIAITAHLHTFDISNPFYIEQLESYNVVHKKMQQLLTNPGLTFDTGRMLIQLNETVRIVLDFLNKKIGTIGGGVS